MQQKPGAISKNGSDMKYNSVYVYSHSWKMATTSQLFSNTDAPILGRLLAFVTYITLGWKGLPGANMLAYLAFSVSDKEKSSINLTLGRKMALTLG